MLPDVVSRRENVHTSIVQLLGRLGSTPFPPDAFSQFATTKPTAAHFKHPMMSIAERL